MNFELNSIIERELGNGERILWIGKPDAGREAQQNGCPAFLFGIPFTAFAIFWTVGAYQMTSSAPPGFGPPGGSTIFPMFGLLFVGVGCYLLLSPFLTYSKSNDTVYAVTNERILIVEGGSSRVVKSYTSQDLGRITRKELADGSGDLIFAQETFRGQKGRVHTRDIGFIGIPNVRSVEKLVRENFVSSHRS